jgi:predicted MPP superfamily phosphohydrolase
VTAVAQALVFLGLVVVVTTVVHYYLWRRLVRDTTRPGRYRRIGTVAVIGLVVLLLAAMIGTRVLPHGASVVLAWPGYLWLAVMFYLLVGLAILEVPALVVRWRLRRHPETNESRRLFLGRAVAVTAGVASVGIVAPGVGSALGAPRLNRIQVPLARLPRSADGLRIALVSDIHLGPLTGLGRTRRIVEMINSLDADVVAVVGDLVDGSVAELGPAAAPLGDLRSRYGSFFVTGNHEYFSGYEEWIDEVTRLGMTPLRNAYRELPVGLDIAGVNDVTGRSYGDGPDMRATLVDRDPARAVVMLAHQPIQAHDAAALGVDLQLSGHTHGGQLAPFNLVVRASGQPIVSGLGEVDGMPVYVTNGAGFWGPPVRVGAPPDITLVELRTR